MEVRAEEMSQASISKALGGVEIFQKCVVKLVLPLQFL